MGKIRIRKVKVLAREVLEALGEKTATDFESNKLLVGQVLRGRISKKMRNKIAGYLTSLAKKELIKESKEKGQMNKDVKS
ncbi:MAG: 30S ribosomal protein S17e [Candidatus Caldarchaeales archaeon]